MKQLKIKIENKIFEIEKIQKEKEKKEDNIFKKPIPKSKLSGLGYSNKKCSKIIQRIECKKVNRKTSMNIKEQENKSKENFYNSFNNLNSKTNIPNIRKAGTNNYLNKNYGTLKHSNPKKI